MPRPHLAFFPQPFAAQAGGNEIRAAAIEAELLATRLDLDALADRAEAEPARDAVVEEVEVRVLELHHTAAVDADEVVVRGLVEKVGVVGGLVVAEVDFAQQLRLQQQAERPVNRGARGLGIQLARALVELLGGEMLVLGEGRSNDRLALAGPPQFLAADEFVESFLNAGVHNANLT